MKHFHKNLILTAFLSFLIAINFTVVSASEDKEDKKVDLCHCERAVQGDVFQCQTQNISESALSAHIGVHQSDYQGPCNIPLPTPDPTHSPCPTPTPITTPEPTPTSCPEPTPEPPSFLVCENQTKKGDVHYAAGWHQIAGGDLLWGRDDVYNLGDGYYTQCYCSPEGRGIQTNWTPVSVGPEWGPDWGLNRTHYNYQNREYHCGGPAPTISPEPNPTGFPQPCNGCGGWPSAPSCGAAKPSCPLLLSEVRHGTTAVLTWTASSPVTHYSISYGTKPGEYIYGAANVGNVTTYTVGSLDPGTKYYFSVNAVNDCMPSDPSTSCRVLGLAIGGAEVKGLAFTGNSSLIYLMMFTGCAFLTLSLATNRFKGNIA
jgi:hypothetical protein